MAEYDVATAVLGAAGGAYTARDVIGANPIALPALKANTGDRDFTLHGVTVRDYDANNVQLEVWFFDGAPAAVANNAAFAVSDSDMDKFIDRVSVATADYAAAGAGASAATVRFSPPRVMRCTGVPNIMVVSVGAPTLTTGIRLEFTVDRD